MKISLRALKVSLVSLAMLITVSVSMYNAQANTALPNGTYQTSYNTAASSTATGPYMLSSGSLPAGLTLDNINGTISGTPTAAGTSNFSIDIYDSGTLATTTESYTLVIDPAVLTATITVSNKTYDGNTSATILTYAPVGLVGGDSTSTITLSGGTATFNTKDIGTGKAVTATGISMSGSSAANYSYNGAATGSGDITAKALTVTGLTANAKTYDGTTNATLSGTAAVSGVVGSEDVTLSGTGTATFASKSAITQSVNVTGYSLSGVDMGNYTLTQPTLSATINKLTLTGTITVSNKTYDGTNGATITARNLTGAIGGDDVTYTGGTATFSDKNAGTSKTVSAAGLSLTGADAANYNVNTTANTTADIAKLAITVTAASNTKTYDGTNSAAATPTVTSGTIQAGDTANFTETYIDKNAGTGKMINAAGTVTDGNSGNNYTVTFVANSGNISTKTLTVTASAPNKVYDATTATTITLSDDRVAGDVLTATGTASFSDKNVGTGKTVNVTGISISGTDAANYSVNTTTTTTANITAKSITGTVTAGNKVYDANSAATLTARNLSGVIAGDTVTYTGGTATFSDKNVGAGKTVSVTGLSLTGTDAGNYTVNTTANTTADITTLAIVGSVTASNKVYDGATTATVTARNLTGVLGSDVVSYTGGTATFANKNVATGKVVTTTGLSLTGTDSGNYMVNTTATTTANITAKPLTVTAVASNKVYDATTAATVTFSDDRVLGDSLTATGTATFSDKNVGTGKTVTVSSISLSGTDSGNYTVNTTTTTTANITAKALTGTITVNNKTYNGTTAATISARNLTGVIGGDSVTYTGGTATFSDKNVGTGKTVSGTGLSLTGTDAGNYTVNTTANTTANITVRTLAVTATASNKVYDGNTSATITLSDNRVAGDVLTIGGTGTFANKNVGTGKTVTVSGITVTGTDAGNYSANTTTTTTADITARPVTVTATNLQKERLSVDPTLTYSVTSGTVVSPDTFSGALTRAVGETVGTYAINQGTLTLGSNYTITYNPGTFTIVDTTPPTLTSVAIVSNNASTSLAKVGDVVTLTFSASEEINTPVVTIAGHSVTVSGTATTTGPFTATYTMVTGDTEGTVPFTIDYSDSAANNAGTQVSTTTNTSSVRFDKTPPTLAITMSNSTVTYELPVLVTFTFSEKVMNFNNSDISVDSGTLTTVSTTDSITYTATYTPTENTLVADQYIRAGAVWNDLAGNAALTGASSSPYNVISSAPRVLPSLSIGGGGGSSSGSGSSPSLSVIPTSTSTVIVQSTSSTTLAPTLSLQTSPLVTPVTGQVLGASAVNFVKDLRLGLRGDDVKALQMILVKEGFLNADSTTGYFGVLTRAALMKWQKAHGIPATGFFGPLSRRFLNNAQ